MAPGKRIQQIVVADQHLLYRKGLRTLISNEPDLQIKAEAEDAAELVRTLSSGADVVVMDVCLLPEANDRDLREIRRLQSRSPFLFLSREDSPAWLELAVKAGGQGYMLKSSPVAEIVAGIRRVASGANRDGLQATADLKALAESGEKFARTSVLTAREQEIMRLLAEGRTVRETAGELSLSAKTVEAHKLNLMRKLNIHSRATLVQYAVSNGFIPSEIPT